MSKKSNFIVLDEASTICGNWFTKHPFMSIRKRKTLDQIKEIVKLKK